MTLREALEIVLELARDNLAPEEMVEEYTKQVEACNMLEAAVDELEG